MLKDSNTDKILEGIYSPKTATHASVIKKSFEPWHKPRKQWIRENQWLDIISKHIDKFTLTDGRPLRYISLPGKDFLDVRVLKRIFEERSVKLKCVGFDDSCLDDKDLEKAISMHEITSLDFLDKTSILIPDRFQTIAKSESLAYTYLEKHGSYDVINLDFCQFISTKKDINPSFYDAILKLLTLQIKKQTTPWLFFMTTLCTPESANNDHISKFKECMDENIKKSIFDTSLKNTVNIDYASLPKNYKTWNIDTFRNFFCIAFSKWLQKIMLTSEPKCRVEMLPSFVYRVYQSNPDMLSLAFLFSPKPKKPVDSSGLATNCNALETTEIINETNSALSYIEATNQCKDVDLILNDDKQLFNAMKYASKLLLKSARYDVKEYDNFADTDYEKLRKQLNSRQQELQK